MRRWIRVFKAVRVLMHVVADADENSEDHGRRAAGYPQGWGVVRAYRGH